MAETITLRRTDKYKVPVLFRGLGRFSSIVIVDDPHREGPWVIFEPDPDLTVHPADAREVYRDYVTHLRKQLEEEQKLHLTTILRKEPLPKVIRDGEVIYPLTDVTNSHNPTIPDWYDYPTEPGVWRLVATDQGRQYRDEIIYVAQDQQGVLRQKIGSLYADLLKTAHEYGYRYYGPMAPDPLTKVKPWK